MNVTTELWEEINARLEAVEQQRNRALADHAIAAGRLSVAAKMLSAKKLEIETLTKTNAELEARLAAPKGT